MLNLIAILIGLAALPGALIAFLPLFGWLYWFVLPVAVVGLVFGVVSRGRTGMQAGGGCDRPRPRRPHAALPPAKTTARSCLPPRAMQIAAGMGGDTTMDVDTDTTDANTTPAAPLLLAASLFSAAGKLPVTILAMSFTEATATTAAPPPPGSVAVRARNGMRAFATVAWVNGQRIGLTFDEPVAGWRIEQLAGAGAGNGGRRCERPAVAAV